MPGRMNDPDWMIRRSSVEILPRWMTLLREKRIIVTAPNYPLASRRLRSLFLECGDDIVEAAHGPNRWTIEVHVVETQASPRGKMIVGGVESRQQSLSAQVRH